jgi:hypothetical protein
LIQFWQDDKELMEDKMKIDDFVLENWLNPACDSEKNKVYLGGSCVLPLTVEELFELKMKKYSHHPWRIILK